MIGKETVSKLISWTFYFSW